MQNGLSQYDDLETEAFSSKMEEKNGEVFDHSELLAQIGGVTESESLRDFLLNPSGMIEHTSTAKNIPVPTTQTGGSAQETMWAQGYGCNEQTGVMLNHNRTGFNLPVSAPPMEIPMENANALLENLVKNFPSAETVLDQFSSSSASPSLPIARNISGDSKPVVGDGSNPLLNTLFGGLSRINSEKVTQDLLDNLSKLESSDMIKCGEYDHIQSWNGLICDSINNVNFQSQNRLTHGLQSSIDKNGNSALFSSSHDKIGSINSNPSDHFTQNNFMARLSPSASVETGVRTPATSYESASPLSSNRTPIRSDESISPMGSGHTPLRVEESTSPLTNIKTPLHVEEGSPLGRTPLRVEESFSPMGSTSSSVLTSNSPSHKGNGQTQAFDTYSSPSSQAQKRVDARSPTGPSSHKSDAPDRRPRQKVAGDGDGAKVEVTAASAEEDGLKDLTQASSPADGDSDGPSDVSPGKQVHGTDPTAFDPLDDPVNKKSIQRTLSRKSDSELYVDGSSGLGQCENVTKTLPATELGCGQKTDLTSVPVVERSQIPGGGVGVGDCGSGQQTPSDVRDEDFFSKSKKRRKKSESEGLPNAKRRTRKRVTIYQSSMSPEESGIKLKIKLASAFQRVKPQKKRRSKKQFGSDEEEEDDSAARRSKKIVRFSSEIKETESLEQTEWGSKIPAKILQKIFQMVVEEQGCVPSLVRFSSVCKLWNTVANLPELWQNIDLSSPYIKQKCKIDRYFRWLLENRLENIRELNLSGWKFSNITMVLSLIGTHCTDIESIGLAGWQGLHYEHLRSLLQDCPRLNKLDLSDVSPESKSTNSAVSQKSITFLTQTMGERLTQLILAHNTLTCLPQIISSLATHCPNLQVLDLSNIRRVSHTEFALNIEHLQEGCQKLKVLRITNSCITLANVPLEKQVASPGFTNLEELSIAGHQGTESLRITSVMDDSCLERILKTSHKLKLLDVRGCTRITDSSLVRVPAWDIQHLFLSGCYVTRQCGSGLELIAQKWCHSLVEIDLAWTTVTDDLNAAVMAFAEKGSESPLRVVNLCGSSVTLEPVKALLSKCTKLEWLNLQSCRGLPRGVKRLYENEQLTELRNMLDKMDRDSSSECGDDGRRESECEGVKVKESPLHSTNTKDGDFVT